MGEGCREWMGVQSGPGVTVELYAQDGADIGEARGTGLGQHLGYSHFCHMAACPRLCSLSASREGSARVGLTHRASPASSPPRTTGRFGQPFCFSSFLHADVGNNNPLRPVPCSNPSHALSHLPPPTPVVLSISQIQTPRPREVKEPPPGLHREW